jgi:hypothetical protein
VSRLDAIVDGLEYLGRHYKEWGIESIAVPPLGCGNGQLEWKVVGPVLIRHLRRLDILVELYVKLDEPTTEAVDELVVTGTLTSGTIASLPSESC